MDYKELSEGSQNVKATVKTDTYSWGKMKTVHHGSSFSIPLHPEHHEAIAKLKDQQEHKFKDETGRHWTAKRDGEDVHFHGANGGNKTKVAHSTMKESHAPVAPVPDKKYIKGTPENKALKALRKPINGMPTNKMKEETMPQSFKGFLLSLTELTDKQKKHIDKNNNGKIDAHDFKLLQKEDDQTEESHQSKTTMKHIPNASPALKKAAKDIKPGIAGYRDRIAMLKAGGVKEEVELDEGSGPKEKQKTPYRDINSPEYKAAADKQRQQMAKDKAAEAGKKMLAKNEEVEVIDELSKSTLGSYAKKATRDSTITRKIASDFEHMSDRARTPGMKQAAGENAQRYKEKSWKRRDGLDKAVDRLTKEETMAEALDPSEVAGNPKMYDASTAKKAYYHNKATPQDKKTLERHLDQHHGMRDWRKTVKEDLDEAMINGREYASHGLMHPTHAGHAVHKVTGNTIDFYAHGTGDKVSGKVTKNDGKAVHIKDTSGKTHRFEVSTNLPKQQNEDHKKDDIPFDGPYTKRPSTVKDKSGAVHGPMSRARDLARKAMQKKMKEEFNIEITEEQAADLCDTASINEKVDINHGMKEETQREDTMKTYKDFVTEIKMADLPSRSVKGTSYGAQYHDPEGDDDAEDKKPKASKSSDAPKRGRGRPSGSKSGAKQQGSEKSSNYGGIDRTTYALRLPNNNK